MPTGLMEDRYVKSVEMREENDFNGKDGRQTVGSRYVIHHMIMDGRRPGYAPPAAKISTPTQPAAAGRFTKWAAMRIFSRMMRANSCAPGSVLNPYSIHTPLERTGYESPSALRIYLLPQRLPAEAALRAPALWATAAMWIWRPIRQTSDSTLIRFWKNPPRSRATSRISMPPGRVCASKRSGAIRSKPSTAWATITTG